MLHNNLILVDLANDNEKVSVELGKHLFLKFIHSSQDTRLFFLAIEQDKDRMECRYIDLFDKPVKHQVYDNFISSAKERLFSKERLFENLDKLVEIHKVGSLLVAQFNDMLAVFDGRNWKELTEPSKTSTMVKQHLIKGNGEKLFFAKADSAGSKIFRIDDTRTEVEVFELKELTIIFFEPDNEITEKNSKKQQPH